MFFVCRSNDAIDLLAINGNRFGLYHSCGCFFNSRSAYDIILQIRAVDWNRTKSYRFFSPVMYARMRLGFELLICFCTARVLIIAFSSGDVVQKNNAVE